MAVAAAAMAIGIQVQTTAHIGDSQIRLAIADLFIPVIFVIALAHSPGFFTARWRVRHIWAWLGVLSAAFTISLVVGRIGAGEWIRWAVVNKYAGWYVLLMYFLVGGWLAAAYGDVATQTFLRWFLVAFWAGCALVGFRYLPQFELGSVFFLEGVRFQALMENPNAFGILAALAIAVQAPQLAAKPATANLEIGSGLTMAAMVATAVTPQINPCQKPPPSSCCACSSVKTCISYSSMISNVVMPCRRHGVGLCRGVNDSS